jgi:hypothetical protein
MATLCGDINNRYNNFILAEWTLAVRCGCIVVLVTYFPFPEVLPQRPGKTLLFLQFWVQCVCHVRHLSGHHSHLVTRAFARKRLSQFLNEMVDFTFCRLQGRDVSA